MGTSVLRLGFRSLIVRLAKFFNYSLVFLMIKSLCITTEHIKVNYHYYDSYPSDSQTVKDPSQ